MKQPFFVNENNCCANIIQSNEMSQGLITFGIWRRNVKVDAGTRWHPLAPAGTTPALLPNMVIEFGLPPKWCEPKPETKFSRMLTTR
jgi:hypothetical protein